MHMLNIWLIYTFPFHSIIDLQLPKFYELWSTQL